MVKVVKILNAHADSLNWVDRNTGIIYMYVYIQLYRVVNSPSSPCEVVVLCVCVCVLCVCVCFPGNTIQGRAETMQ